MLFDARWRRNRRVGHRTRRKGCGLKLLWERGQIEFY